MSAILIAKAAYGCERSFAADLDAHLVHGWVASTPQLFAMARPVRHNADPRLLSNIAHRFRCEERDCWLIWSAAGPLPALVKLLPYPLPFVAFHRRRDPRLRVYRWQRLAELAATQRRKG